MENSSFQLRALFSLVVPLLLSFFVYIFLVRPVSGHSAGINLPFALLSLVLAIFFGRYHGRHHLKGYYHFFALAGAVGLAYFPTLSTGTGRPWSVFILYILDYLVVYFIAHHIASRSNENTNSVSSRVYKEADAEYYRKVFIISIIPAFLAFVMGSSAITDPKSLGEIGGFYYLFLLGTTAIPVIITSAFLGRLANNIDPKKKRYIPNLISWALFCGIVALPNILIGGDIRGILMTIVIIALFTAGEFWIPYALCVTVIWGKPKQSQAAEVEAVAENK